MQIAASQYIFLFRLRAKHLKLPRRKAICSSPQHSHTQQPYLDTAEPRLEAPRSNTKAASRKGARGVSEPGVRRPLLAALLSVTVLLPIHPYGPLVEPATRLGWG